MLKLGVLGTAAVALPLERVARAGQATIRMAASKLPKPFTTKFDQPPVLTPAFSSDTTDYYSMEMRSTLAEIIPGYKTELWTYNGIAPGPTLRVARGRQVKMRQVNNLPRKHPILGYESWTSVHLHGNASKPQYDGYADDITWPGQYKDYHYSNDQAARTLWYHDHGAHHTAENAYMGLAGLYLTSDPKENLPIPRGRYDVPLVVRDAIFTDKGQLGWDDESHSGLYGDVILVNGRPWPVMQVERRKYRFRILNASVSRGFNFTLSTGDPFAVIGTDGGLMKNPQWTTSMRHGMAERYEIVIDFAKYRVGQRITLKNLGVRNARDYADTDKVMAFDVVADATSTDGNSIPEVLDPNPAAMYLEPTPTTKTRRFEFIRTNGEWTINGHTWHDVIESGYKLTWANPALGDVEVWEFVNNSGGWNHPVHVHLVDFKVLDRNGKPPYDYEKGPKDVVFIGEGETVRLITKFGPHQGKYMIHCHNLVHEDHDMMAQFEVGPPDGGDDPREADPCADLPAPDLW
jgi:FtsP/CotA-like multicopper oxidase with cupredoxin domain